MSEERELDLGLNDLEQSLRKLAPKSPRMDVAQAMFLAGQQSALARQPGRMAWPIAAMVLLVVSATLGTLLAVPDEPRIVYIDREIQVEDNGKDAKRRSDKSMPGPVEGPRNESSIDEGTIDEALEFFRSRRLAIDDSLDRLLPVTPVSTATSVSPLRYGDWRAELDHQSLLPSDSEPDSPLWLQILSTKGSL